MHYTYIHNLLSGQKWIIIELLAEQSTAQKLEMFVNSVRPRQPMSSTHT